ncbi:MAG TPA: hypothetical protein VI233_16200 [Puia sp.]
MEKGSFTGPFWFLIVLGVITSITHTYGLYLISSYSREVSLVYKILFFFWTYVVFIEAIVYWRIRYRNVYRKASWGHVILLGVAILSPAVLYPFLGVFGRHFGSSSYLTALKVMQTGIKVFLYGGLVVGHALFVQVLIKVRESKKAEVAEGGVNLLDDVGWIDGG